MKNLNRILGLGLSAALLAGTLVGCAKNGADPTASTDPTASPAVTAPVGEAPLVETEDMVLKFAGIPADTTMFTVDGEAVAAEQFYYWLSTAVDSIGYYNFGSADAIDWTMEQEGQKIGDFILESAKQTAQFYRIVESKVNEEGIALTAEEQAELQTQTADNIAQYGEEEYVKQLQQMGLSDAGFRHLVEVSYRYQVLQEKLAATMTATAEEMAAFATTGDLLAAKHILIETVDDAGAALPEEEKAAKTAQAEDLLAQLQAVSGDEQLALFDTLMNENSEDGRDESNALYSANGYLFGAGEMVPVFEDGTRALEPGQISGLVESDYGYHIILRLTPDSGDLLYSKEKMPFSEYMINSKLEEVTDGWMTAAKVEDTAEMEKVDVQGFYTQLSAYRASLVPVETPAPTETPASTETPTPSPSAAG